ncbi:hypothetical protein SASPL_103441 [Salvia splendens]|uniref:Retrotransposon Copia-like N-terminal domain-containing protein n=1 Tax=Salvia splendens TaxID=180675 RepID=A0A8X8YG52_SALSN|nr:hypothetical protein SASPL_103441 [Salvia splendens]
MSDFRPPIGTTIKLNGSNYMLWSRAFLLFLGSQKKKSHVQTAPPATTDANYDTWCADDCSVMTWLLNSLEPAISQNIMCLDSAKAMWDALREMFFNDKNVSRVFELYEKLFSHTQDTQSVNDYFSTLKGLADEILVYHPLSCDATTRAKQWEEFMVAKFLSGLNADLQPLRDSLMASDDIPTLSNALSRVLRVSTGRTESTSFDNSAMSARGRGSYGGLGRGQGRGRGRGRGFHDRLCDHCGRSNHESDKCWKKFGKPDWANNIEFAAPSSSSTTTDASTSVAAFAVSPGKSWMLDSGASTHITGTKSLLTSFSPSSLPSVRLADGNYSPVTGTGVVKPTTHITLDNVLFAPNFPDLQTKRTIGGGHERGGLYYLDNVSHVSPSALSAAVSPYQWHCRLGHPSSASLRSLVPVASVDFNYVARTLMSHMHVPKYLWSDAVLTACFLINRMPSSVLHGDIPFSCLHPDKPLYHIPPRIFGCTCFVHDLTPGLDKLSPRSIKCVYTRRRRPATAPEAPETVPTVSCPLQQSSSPPASENPPPSDELPIAIRKVIPTSYQEALKHPLWRAAMDEEMRALLSRVVLISTVMVNFANSNRRITGL